MDRRRLLQIVAALPFAKILVGDKSAAAAATTSFWRVRPGDPQWPSDQAWAEFGRGLTGQLIKAV